MINKDLHEAVLARNEYINQYHRDSTFYRAIQYLDAAGPTLENCIHMMYNMSKIIEEQRASLLDVELRTVRPIMIKIPEGSTFIK